MSKLKVTPTGCPGPIPGTRVWRCDGKDCAYGPTHYASCKDEIARRGYTLRITSDLTDEMLQDAELRRQNVQGELAQLSVTLQSERAANQVMLQAKDRTIAEDIKAYNALMHTLSCQCDECLSLRAQMVATHEELDEWKGAYEGVKAEYATMAAEYDKLKDTYEQMILSVRPAEESTPAENITVAEGETSD